MLIIFIIQNTHTLVLLMNRKQYTVYKHEHTLHCSFINVKVI